MHKGKSMPAHVHERHTAAPTGSCSLTSGASLEQEVRAAVGSREQAAVGSGAADGGGGGEVVQPAQPVQPLPPPQPSTVLAATATAAATAAPFAEGLASTAIAPVAAAAAAATPPPPPPGPAAALAEQDAAAGQSAADGAAMAAASGEGGRGRDVSPAGRAESLPPPTATPAPDDRALAEQGGGGGGRVAFYYAAGVGHSPAPRDRRRMIEVAERVTEAYDALSAAGLVQRCERQEARLASDEELRRVHRQEHLEQVRRRSEEQRPANGSVYYSSEADTAARLACGAVVDAALAAVAPGGPRRAFALVWLPGHRHVQDTSATRPRQHPPCR
uniref:histone deacetylase n=1 Tax=Emiliania huxleyi TaxID=2903 RepID=A0A7S3RTZ2_EMIHU